MSEETATAQPDRISDVLGMYPFPTDHFPAPGEIKDDTADANAIAYAEEALDASLNSEVFWQNLLEKRGVTNLCRLLFALLNQDRLDPDDESAELRWTERQVRSGVTAGNLNDYTICVLRAYGQASFAKAVEFQNQMSTQRAEQNVERMKKAAEVADEEEAKARPTQTRSRTQAPKKDKAK